jgi:hypothetical protein
MGYLRVQGKIILKEILKKLDDLLKEDSASWNERCVPGVTCIKWMHVGETVSVTLTIRFLSIDTMSLEVLTLQK